MTGEMGEKGDAGTDGSLRVYGDGSAGPLLVDVGEEFEIDSANTQFTDITVRGLLVVGSGTVLRATGAVDLSGEVRVLYGTDPGTLKSPPHPGISSRAPGFVSVGPSGTYLAGGSPGIGIMEVAARQLLRPGPFGGGGGTSYDEFGGRGGGALSLVAAGPLEISGDIHSIAYPASGGYQGGGGGGGGVLILASRTSVSIEGSVGARGGDGADSHASLGSGAGGGGGGGIIHLVAPTITQAGVLDVSGGQPGSDAENATGTTRHSGAGGGASGGDGGRGGDVAMDGSTTPAQAGEPGYVFQTVADPTSIL